MPVLQDFITAHHRQSVGAPAHAEHLGFVAAARRDPALLTEATEELSRLDQLDSRFAGGLHLRDHDQHIRRLALSGMLADYQEQPL